ncbi:hypothetical protein D5018_01970 [Parashewanella curva]|uniref:Uncharacterized protein n=1 Tax=Parashewanella curva TaxID=2338552 RepID=A0A3L8Q1Y3_9GAMM|nr:hypothetical protein [Parashewanella curva]RLV61480.1 hypothetical protein D5018_01970 [Parashewanella curva]
MFRGFIGATAQPQTSPSAGTTVSLSPTLNQFRNWMIENNFPMDDGLVAQLSRNPSLARLGDSNTVKQHLQSAVNPINQKLTLEEVVCLDAAQRFIASETQRATEFRSLAKATKLRVEPDFVKRVVNDERVNRLGSIEELQSELKAALQKGVALNSTQAALLSVCDRVYASGVKLGQKVDMRRVISAKSFLEQMKKDGVKVTQKHIAQIARLPNIKMDEESVENLISEAVADPSIELTHEHLVCLEAAKSIVYKHFFGRRSY